MKSRHQIFSDTQLNEPDLRFWAANDSHKIVNINCKLWPWERESLLAQKNNAGNQKGLCPSMLVPIVTIHNSEYHGRGYRLIRPLAKSVPCYSIAMRQISIKFSYSLITARHRNTAITAVGFSWTLITDIT